MRGAAVNNSDEYLSTSSAKASLESICVRIQFINEDYDRVCGSTGRRGRAAMAKEAGFGGWSAN